MLALLALSGILFLVPLAVPVHATQNAASPTFTATPNVVVGASATAFSVKVANPASNAYAVTSVTFVAPSGWTFSAFPASCGTNSGVTWTITTSSGSVNCAASAAGGNILPGFSFTMNLGSLTGPTASATSPPVTGAFTTTVIDAASSPASYAGSSFNEYAIASTTITSVALTGNTTPFVAGTSPYTVTATLSSGEPGVPIVWTITSGTYPTSGFTSTLSPSSTTTGSSGTATATFTPSNKAGDSTTLTATVGTSAIALASIAVATTAAAPSQITFGLGAATTAFPTTDYVTTSGTTASSPAFTGAEVTGASVFVSVADKFANPDTFGGGGVTFGASQAITLTALSGGGIFDTTSQPTTITCGTTAGFTCPSSGSSFNPPFNLFQNSIYGTIGKVSATVTGTYNSASFSASGASGNIFTSTFAVSSPVPIIYGSKVVATGSYEVGGVSHTCTAGSPCVPAGNTITVSTHTALAQQGVPVTFYVCEHSTCSTTTSSYSGKFSNSATSITTNTNSSNIAAVTFSVSNTAAAMAQFVVNVAAPTNTASTNMLGNSTSSALIQTEQGSISKLVIATPYLNTGTPGPSATNAVNGSTLYVNVLLADSYGNAVTVANGQQIQISLSTSAGLLSATTVYVTSGDSATNQSGSFGPIAWTLPTALGTTATISGTAVLSGASASASASITTVSAKPTISVTSPKPQTGVIYSGLTSVTFSGEANVSLGYAPTVTISHVGYKVGSNTWQSAIISSANKVTWSAVVPMSSGLSTVTFNATDSNKNVVVSQTFSVLVDTSAPTITLTTKAGATVNASSPFTASIVDTAGDLNASSVGVTYNGTALASSAIHVTGTNNNGQSVTYTVTATLPSGKWSTQVSAKDYAENAATPVTETVIAVVPTDQSFTAGTPSQVSGGVGGFPALQVTYTNNLPSSQTAIIYGVAYNSIGQAVSIGTATGTWSAGGSQQVDVVFAGLSPGTYSVKLFAVTTTGTVIALGTTGTLSA